MFGARVEHKDEFFIAGFRGTVKQGEGPARLWEQLSKHAAERGVTMEGVHSMGVMIGMNTSGEMDYMAGILVENLETAQALGLNALKVDGGEFAVAPVKGTPPVSTMGGVELLLGSFLPQAGFKPNGPVFEAYGPGDPSSKDYEMQVWIPVKAA